MKLPDWLIPGVFALRRQIDDHEVSEIEAYLDAALHPVDPRTSFVVDLRKRLMQEPNYEKRPNLTARYAILGFAGVISGLILFVTGLRAILTLLGALGLLRQSRNQTAQKGVATAN